MRGTVVSPFRVTAASILFSCKVLLRFLPLGRLDRGDQLRRSQVIFLDDLGLLIFLFSLLIVVGGVM